jgi:hypothetical protein
MTSHAALLAGAKTRRDILAAIQTLTLREGSASCYRIAALLGRSSAYSNIARHLRLLCAWGYIDYTPGKDGSYVLTEWRVYD